MWISVLRKHGPKRGLGLSEPKKNRPPIRASVITRRRSITGARRRVATRSTASASSAMARFALGWWASPVNKGTIFSVVYLDTGNPPPKQGKRPYWGPRWSPTLFFPDPPPPQHPKMVVFLSNCFPQNDGCFLTGCSSKGCVLYLDARCQVSKVVAKEKTCE